MAIMCTLVYRETVQCTVYHVLKYTEKQRTRVDVLIFICRKRAIQKQPHATEKVDVAEQLGFSQAPPPLYIIHY